MNTTTFATVAGDRPEAADQHEPETIGALLEALNCIVNAGVPTNLIGGYTLNRVMA